MIARAISLSLGQAGDPAFRRVLARGIGLTLLGLAVMTVAVIWGLGRLLPETIDLGWFGQINWLDEVLSWGAFAVMLLLSWLLMIPTASAVTSIFLEDVAQAVEDQHYPGLPPAEAAGLLDGILDSVGFLGTMVAANLLALVLYLLFLPLAPVIFLALNGFLLGREYFTMAAARRLGLAQARALRRRHALTIWVLGVAMAVPLSVPLLSLLVPVFGAAAFTHLFHMVTARR